MLDLILTSATAEINKQLSKLGYSSALKVVLFHPKNIKDFKQLKQISTSDILVIGTSQNEKLIREILENKHIDGFVNIESSTGRDHTHYRRGNLNQVLAKITKKNGKIYFIDFSRILGTQDDHRYLLLGRIIQNTRILQKYQVPISIASFAKDAYGLRSKSSLVSFARVLGVRRPKSIEKVFQEKQDKLSGKIIRKGVRVLR